MTHQIQIQFRYILLGEFKVSNGREIYHFIITQSNLSEHLKVLGKLISISGIKRLVVYDMDRRVIIWNTEEPEGHFEAGRYIVNHQSLEDWMGKP